MARRHLTRILACAALLAVLGGARDASGQSTCVTESCHKDLAVDAPHKAKGVTCGKCHSSVTDGQKEHKDALDVVPPEKLCAQSGCHATETEKIGASKHRDAPCENCHGPSHGTFTRVDWSACKSCHGDATLAITASAHGSEAKKPVKCTDCHGDMHDLKLHGDPTSPMSKVMQVTTCGECHDKDYVRAYRTSVHGQGLLRSGLVVAPTCSDCHGGHQIAKVKSDAARVSKLNSVETCGKCHEFILQRWKNSKHGQMWQAARERKDAAANGKPVSQPARPPKDKPKEGPVCTSCHPGHLTFDPMVYGNHLKMADRCGECHEAERRTYRESFHGKATRLGLRAAATCADCHTPHEMLPKEDLHSTINPKNLVKTCGHCHEGATAAFVKFDVHMDPTDHQRDGRIFFIWAFMTTLLVSTLAFFTIHAFLWFQRSMVALWRKELHRQTVADEPWVRRFRPLHMGIHVVIVMTFLLLAATGLPIKFSGAGWAHVIETILGGPEITRWAHRIAGIVTFGYSMTYLGYLVRELVVRRRRALLWGWQSMVPARRDWGDLVANLRWFLYLGPPPRLDRWAYWEKFDFFAVFWGVPVIGLSGLLLWEPLFFTRFLPGWVINAAYVVHSDEALLATGFIFFFHFFHTHLRPEAFPLDTVIFLGGMPLSRFQHERPVEHERAVASGELDKMLMPAPDPQAVRRAMRFGTVALCVGVVLGGLLLVTGLQAVFH